MKTRYSAVCAFFAVVALGCAVHDPVPVFRSAVFVGERGISVPLPPPSLVQQPQQEVDVEGDVEGEPVEEGTVVRIVDHRGGAQTEVELDDGAEGFHASLSIDVTDNCLEIWLVAPDGNEGERRSYSTRVVGERDLEVLEDCE